MNATDAAEIIEVMTNGLRSNPQQFQISIRVVGQSVTSYGGTGISISVSGGGSGSTTIGNKVSLSDAQVEITQQKGVQAMNEQFGALMATLTEISSELRKPAPDKPLLKRAVDSLKNTWVPGVIVGVVGNIVSKSIGV